MLRKWRVYVSISVRKVAVFSTRAESTFFLKRFSEIDTEKSHFLSTCYEKLLFQSININNDCKVGRKFIHLKCRMLFLLKIVSLKKEIHFKKFLFNSYFFAMLKIMFFVWIKNNIYFIKKLRMVDISKQFFFHFLIKFF